MVSINLVLPITCTGVFVDWAGEFSVLGVAPPCVSFASEADFCLEGQTPAPSKRAVAKASETAVSWTGFGEMALLFALGVSGAQGG